MKKTIFTVSLILIAVFGFKIVSVNVFSVSNPKIVIDAGHGDPDGGAIGIDGTHEADLNLQIALKVYETLRSKNVDCILTRNDKNSVYLAGDTIHQKKVSDINNRIEIAKKYKNAVFLSIHMNTFPAQNVCGLQVFYKSNSTQSKELAENIQNVINIQLQPENQKKIKQIPSNVYLFKNIPNVSVLVECGFLTNPNDLNNLKNEEYQENLSKIISEALIINLFGG